MRDLGTINIIRSVFFVFAGVCAGGNAWAMYCDIVPARTTLAGYAQMYANSCAGYSAIYGDVNYDVVDGCAGTAGEEVIVGYVDTENPGYMNCDSFHGMSGTTFNLCSRCNAGARLVPVSQLVAVGAIVDCNALGSQSLSGSACVHCTPTDIVGDWGLIAPGYERRIVGNGWAESGCGDATGSRVEYRCAAGYYGQSTDGVTGCTRCPDIDGIAATAPAGSTQKSSCCISTNSVGRDAGGAFVYTTGCCGN